MITSTEQAEVYDDAVEKRRSRQAVIDDAIACVGRVPASTSCFKTIGRIYGARRTCLTVKCTQLQFVADGSRRGQKNPGVIPARTGKDDQALVGKNGSDNLALSETTWCLAPSS